MRKKLRRNELIKQGQVEGSIEERVSKNRAWASGKIKSVGIGPVISLWIVTIVWNLTFGVSFVNSFSNPEMKTGAVVILGVFALLGLVPLYFAINFTKRRISYGDSWCIIDGKAGVLGDKMTGVIRTEREIETAGDYTIYLQCTESYSVGSGKNRRTETKVHWQGKNSIPGAGKSARLGIPFIFNLPGHPPETGDPLLNISWNLRIEAPVKSGVSYSAQFIVPVFKQI